MIKLDLVKAGDPEIKLLTSIGSLKKQESSGKTSICHKVMGPDGMILSFLNVEF